ncbi:CCC motif membrane protein [Polaribacter sp. Hel_I_88]|uniref:CCC motif membrane protein n=1 Tax=Polaribacter sp. Hel_I_88 TaxID=1250006 RepID=UPI00047E0598|nr:CCC motif membrane protein [Polaribacter sp. Hel_I_88]
MKKLSTTLIYILSSLSLLCCCFAGLGILLALPSFLIANKKLKEAHEFPDEYDFDAVKAMKTAKTFALVALSINGLYFIYSIYSLATTDWDTFMNEFNSQMEKYQ